MSKDFWQNKRVLITGAGGFIGRHLIDFTINRGAKVLGLTRSPTVHPAIRVGDISNWKFIRKAFSEFLPDICFHLAGETLVEQGQKEPYETFKNNVISTLNILELGRKHKTQRIIVASTVHVYGDNRLPYQEDDPPRPSRPYETSKTCTDLMSQSYADSFHLPVLIPRFVNVYGPGDLNFERVIPKTISTVLKGQNPVMWGGKTQREYLYITDAIIAYNLLAQMSTTQIERNRIYNFGTGDLVSVSALIYKIIRLSQSHVSIKKVAVGRSDELPKQLVSWNKATKVLGWKPKVRLENGLKQTIDWYRNYFRMGTRSRKT